MVMSSQVVQWKGYLAKDLGIEQEEMVQERGLDAVKEQLHVDVDIKNI